MGTRFDDLGLIQLFTETASILDERSRIVALNDGLNSPVGRFTIHRTSIGNSCNFRHDVDEDLVHELQLLCDKEPVLDPSDRPLTFLDDYLRLLEVSFGDVGTGPYYWFADDIVATGQTVEIDESNVELLIGSLEPWRRAVPHYRPFRASVEAGRAVSVCTSVRRTRAAHVAGCETDPDYRRRGHVAKAVSAWACQVQQQDAVAFYNTDWTNVASRKVAESLGATLFASGFNFA